MAVFRCKMCGGTLKISNETVVVCEYCGTQQTLPRLDDEIRANMYDRANHYRRNNEFDKAMGIYEQILNEDKTDAEAYWSLVLCRYGIEYVEDPASHKRIPTVNRAQFTSIFDDEDYKSALEYADTYQKCIYEQEASAINEIQKGILAISQKEEPFDVFICYKETDNSGHRTPDSVLAADLYNELTREGFKVFFSRITLEDKLGTAYEPYIFAALNSAKVMVVLGTKAEYFNAAWVKNEWSRYLALIKNGAKKLLIPAYKDMSPYDLPEEFSHLQAQDMSKLGFMQDLVYGIKKIVEREKENTAHKTIVTHEAGASVDALLKRVFIFLSDGDFVSANEYCEKVLDIDPENAEAYLGKLMAELKFKRRDALAECMLAFEDNINYRKADNYGDAHLKNELQGYLERSKLLRQQAEEEKHQKAERRRKAFKKAMIISLALLLVVAVGIFGFIKLCVPAIKYNKALESIKNKQYDVAYDTLVALGDYKDCKVLLKNFVIKYENESIINSEGNEVAQYQYKYNQDGKLIYRKDLISGSFTEYEYDENGNLTRCHYGPITQTWEYDNNGKVIRNTYQSDDTYQYSVYEAEYDKNGNMIYCCERDKYNNLIEAEEYEYDKEGRLVKEKRFDNDIESPYQIVTIKYDEQGRRIERVCHVIGTDKKYVSTWEYDKNGNLVKTVIDTSNYGQEYAPQATKYKYDANGNLIDDGYTKYTYDKNNNCIKEENEVTITTRVFNDQNVCTELIRKPKSKDQWSFKEEIEKFDDVGRLVEIKDILSDEFDDGAYIEEAGYTEYVTKYEYSENGYLIKKITEYDNGEYEEVRYNEFGDNPYFRSPVYCGSVIYKMEYKDAERWTETKYDEFGNKLEQITVRRGEKKSVETTYSGRVVLYLPLGVDEEEKKTLNVVDHTVKIDEDDYFYDGTGLGELQGPNMWYEFM